MMSRQLKVNKKYEAMVLNQHTQGHWTRLKISSNRRPGVRHSTFESLCLGRSSQSIASGFLRLWDSLNFKKDREFVGFTVLFLDEKVNSVIHGFTPVGRANHYMPSLKACSIVKVDHFEVARCSSMYKITDHPFLIRFISLTIIDEVITGAPEISFQSRLDYVVGQICYAQGSDLTKDTTRVVIRLLIDPGGEPEPQHVVDGDEIRPALFKGNDGDECEPIPGDDCEAIVDDPGDSIHNASSELATQKLINRHFPPKRLSEYLHSRCFDIPQNWFDNHLYYNICFRSLETPNINKPRTFRCGWANSFCPGL
ncbi:hypothetical protein DY000_02047900 [Brassica cretica]|uniref:DUF223 domain-containing protein n=1 Tax=Brassica cretica TaxID=69181 RepID=A0ABQ7F1I7_BRACR|nr:hypothetical protein DY000_02047900 [Brassica cretica]